MHQVNSVIARHLYFCVATAAPIVAERGVRYLLPSSKITHLVGPIMLGFRWGKESTLNWTRLSKNQCLLMTVIYVACEAFPFLYAPYKVWTETIRLQKEFKKELENLDNSELAEDIKETIAEKGSDELGMCCYRLAMHYYKSTGGNREKAAKWMEAAVNQNIVEAQLKLATFYRLGIGVQKDVNKSAQLLQKAASQGNAKAQRILCRRRRTSKRLG